MMNQDEPVPQHHHPITLGLDTGTTLVSSREWEAFFAGCIDLAAKIRQRRAARQQAQTEEQTQPTVQTEKCA